MSDYKLVPVEPTADMLSRAMRVVTGFSGAYGEINDYLDEETAREVYADMLAAAPAVQGEPAARNDPAVAPDGFVLMPRGLTDEMVRAFCMATVLRWDDAPEDQKIEVAEKLQRAFDAVIAAAPQPAEQQPAPDVSALVKALEAVVSYHEEVYDNDKKLMMHYSKMMNEVRGAIAAHQN